MSHQFTILLAVACAFFITWFIFKKLFKLALLVFLVFVGICGYFYIKNPDTARENIKKTMESTEKKTVETWDKGVETYKKAEEYVEKGKKKIEDAEKLLKKEEEKDAKP
jgi:uncharacterized protein YxeA